jgi:hypothetical protein
MSLINVVMTSVIASVLAFGCSIEQDPGPKLNIPTAVNQKNDAQCKWPSIGASSSHEVMFERFVEMA